MNKRKKYFILLLLSIVYFINGVLYIPQQSVTGDEADHLHYAIRYVKLQPQKIKPFDDASTMPVSGLNALPRAVEQLIDPQLQRSDGGVNDVFNGRYVTLFICFFIGLFIYKWSKQLYGDWAALFAFFLFVFSPNLMAHAALVTTDMYAALATIATAYYFWRYINLPSWQPLILFSISLGATQLTKQSLTHLLFIFPLLAIFIYFKKGKLFTHFKKKLFKSLVVTATVLAVINIGFLFYNTGLAFKDYTFRSAFFQSLQELAKPLAAIPMPLPEPYLQGLDLTKNLDEIGGGNPKTSGDIYILGRSKSGEGFWYYYFVALFLKTPIPLLFLGCLLMWHWGRRKTPDFFSNEAIPLFIIIYFLLYFSFFYNSQVGIRHILMITPLFIVLVSRVYSDFYRKPHFAKWLSVFSVYLISSFYYFFPNLISYTNEFVLPKRFAYKVLGDSNLDYRQGNLWAERFRTEHPDYTIPTTSAKAGKYVVSVEDILDLNHANKFDWIQNFEPVGHIRHTHLLFVISEQDVKQLY